MTIAETVREAQELMTRVRRTRVAWLMKDINAEVDPLFGMVICHPKPDPPVQYPKSFGELCLDIATDHLRRMPGWTTALRRGWVTRGDNGRYYLGEKRLRWWDILPCDCVALRRAMWHRS